MASIVTESTGRRRVYFDHAGKRKSIPLGNWNRKQAETFKRHLEDLLVSIETGMADHDVESWLIGLDDDLHEKLVAVDLVKSRSASTIKGWLDQCIKDKAGELKPGSVQKLKQTRDKLLAFFDGGKPLRSIDADMASQWRATLVAAGSSIAYVKHTCGNAKTLFSEAVRRGLLIKNPFEHLESGATAAVNDRYITDEEIKLILAACPDVRYKVLFGLARYAGIRVPSEFPRWDQVDFDKGRITIKSPKTERHAGHESRQVPIDPRLMPILLETYTNAPEGEQRVFWAGWNGGFQRMARSVIDKAKVQRWPDLFQALRRSCEMEWAQKYPQYVVSKWIGHSIAVSGKHYANLVTDQFFEAAAGVERQTERAGAESGVIDRNLESAMCGIPNDSTQFTAIPIRARGFEPPTPSTPC